MTVSATSGVPVTLLAQFDANGAAADPELPLVLTIAPVSDPGTPVVTVPSPNRISAGLFSFEWTPPTVSAMTDFVATWNPDGDDLSAVEIVSVFPASLLAWATPEQVGAQTGESVTAAQVALASSIIDTFTGADPEMPEDAISGVDRRHLRKATGWQAAWMKNKVGMITERENASVITSDTQSVTREDRADAMLAPLARREIASLSWIGTRTAIVPRVRHDWSRTNFLNEASDPAWFGGEGAIPR